MHQVNYEKSTAYHSKSHLLKCVLLSNSIKVKTFFLVNKVWFIFLHLHFIILSRTDFIVLKKLKIKFKKKGKI